MAVMLGDPPGQFGDTEPLAFVRLGAQEYLY